jgi:hypothetical protein
VDDRPAPGAGSATGTLARALIPGRSIPPSITGWIRAGTLDAELAALVSVLVEHGLPLVVAAPGAAAASGWAGAEVGEALGLALLACSPPPQPAVRAQAPLTVDAASLEEVLVRIPTLSLEAADETGARVAIVLVLEADIEADAWRIGAAHLLRPPLRDGHGHLQRQGPAVLATWDGQSGSYEHFAWGVMPELALLAQVRAGDLEAEIDQGVDLLAGLVAHEIDDPGAIRLAIEAARTDPAAGQRH